jgi:hypothetical protein
MDLTYKIIISVGLVLFTIVLLVLLIPTIYPEHIEPYPHRISNLTPPLNTTWYCMQLAEEFGDKNAVNFTMINDNECEYWSE